MVRNDCCFTMQAESKLIKMDYNKLVKRRNTNHLLRKENAVIRNISDNKIFEAELIANKDLVPKETAVMKAYREKQQLTNPIYKQNQEQTKLLEKIVEKPTFDYDKLSQSMLKAIQDRPLIDFEGQKSLLQALNEEPVVEYPDDSTDDEADDSDQTEPITYHQIGKNYFMRIIATKNISNLNNEKLDNYVEEYGKELDKFRAHMRKDRVTNAMLQKVLIGNIRKALEKAEEYYNYINTSLRLRRGFTLHDEQQGSAQQGTSIMTNIADVIERFKILYGEITSGNKNIKLINEFREILTIML